MPLSQRQFSLNSSQQKSLFSTFRASYVVCFVCTNPETCLSSVIVVFHLTSLHIAPRYNSCRKIKNNMQGKEWHGKKILSVINYRFQTDLHTTTCSDIIYISNVSQLQLSNLQWLFNDKHKIKSTLNIASTLMPRRHLLYIPPVHRGSLTHFIV